MFININPILGQYDTKANEMHESRRIGIMIAKELQKHKFMTWTKFPKKFGSVSSEAMMCDLLNTLTKWFRNMGIDVDFGEKTRRNTPFSVGPKSKNEEVIELENMLLLDGDEEVEEETTEEAEETAEGDWVVTEKNLRVYKRVIKEKFGRDTWRKIKDMNAKELEKWMQEKERGAQG